MPPPGGYAHVEALGGRPGGSAANVARGLSSAGHDVKLIGRVGNDEIGRELIEDLVRQGIDVAHLERRRASGQALIFVDDTGERTIFAITDAGDDQDVADLPYDDLATADCVYLDGYDNLPAELVTVLRESAALVVTGAPHPGACEWSADLIIGSARHYPERWLEAPFAHAREIVGPRLQWVVVTRGALGADAYGPAGTIPLPVSPVAQVDSTGAGDAFAAGLVHGLLTGANMAEAGRIAAIWGAEASRRLQSAPPMWTELPLDQR